MTIADASANEGDSMTFTVTLSVKASEPFTVTPSFTDGTARKGTDYTENTAAINFLGNSGEQHTFTVATTEDAVVEASETFTVGLTISDTQEERLLTTGTATGTIVNDDTAAVTIADESASEGDQITFTVTLNAAVPGGLTVTPSFTEGTARKGTDYTENTTGISFTGTAGETQTFTVQTVEDTVVEADETFTVGLTVTGTSATITATETATGTIENDDTAEVTIDGDASAAEGDNIMFTLRVDNAVSGGFVVVGAFRDGTATTDTDYKKSLGESNRVTFAGTANEAHTVAVETVEDSGFEEDETFSLSLGEFSRNGLFAGGVSTSDVLTDDQAIGTILNDDPRPPAVTIADASAGEGEGITFTVTLDKAVSGQFYVDPTFTDGTAKKKTDYTVYQESLTFAGNPGETQTFTVTTTEDAAVEPDETFTVGLRVSGTSATITATDTATGTINDDDTAPAVTVEDASADEGDGITFTVTLDAAVSGGLTVRPSFTDGTATKGTDYTENTAGISFTGDAGETQSFTVATIEDTGEESDETFTVSLSVSGASETVTATDTATGTIRNDDTAPAGDDGSSTSDDDGTSDDGARAVNLSVNPSSVGEGASGTAVAVIAAFSTGRTLTEDRTVTVSVGGGTATSGTDYAAVSSFDITVPAGATRGTGTFTLRPNQDTAVEGQETIGVAGRAGSLTVNGTALTLTDDDGAPEVNLSVNPSNVSEGDESTRVTVTAAFSTGSTFSRDTTVRVSVGGGSATSGTDYAAVSAFDVRIRSGETSGTATFTLTPATDARVEAAETIRVTGRSSGLKVNGTRLTLADSTPKLGVRAARAVEGEAMVFTVTLQAAGSQALTVQYATVDGTATAGADYTATSGQLVFSADETERRVRVPVADDAEVEDNETFALAVQLADAPGSPASATGTIVDNDVVRVTVTEPDVRETDGLATFTVSLSTASSYEVVIEYRTSDGTATAGADYIETTGRLVFAPGETEKAVAVQVLDDDVVEGTETLLFSVTVASVGSRTFGLSAAQAPPIRFAGAGGTDPGSPTWLQMTGTIRDDELARTRGSGTSRTLYLLARSMASEAVAAIGERFVATGGDDAPRATLGAAPPAGQGVAGAGAGVGYPAVSSNGGIGASPGAGQGAMALHRVSNEPFADLGWLDNADFSVPVGQANQPGRWQVWGRAGTVRSRLQTRTGGHARGDVFSSHMGVDTRLGDSALLGVSLSHTVGLLGYTVRNPLVEGALPGEGDGRVTSVQPYAHWAPRNGLTLWGMGGGGLGSLTLADSVGMVETPLGLRLFAGGARQALTSGLALKADAFHATLRAAEHADMAAATGTAMRGRMLAEGQTDWALSEWSSLNPRLEAGLRWDGGTDVEGMGAEMGVGLAYVNRRLNLGLETQGRYLVAHQADGFEEWGAGLTLRVGPGVDRPGPWLALNPEWGAPDSRVNALWDPRAAPELHRGATGAPGARPDRIAATAGYRLSEAKSVSLEALHETRPGDGGGVAARVTGNLKWGGGTDGEPRPPADSRFRRGESAAAGDAAHAGRPAPVRLDAVAVAAFHNLSGAPADEWLGAGVKETLTNALEELAAISVVGNGEAGGKAPAWLVAGEYQRRGDRLQIDARVVDTRSGAVAARSRAGGVAAELFELQDRIAADLAGALRNLGAGGRAGGREPAARELPRQRLDERRPEGGDAATAPQRAVEPRPRGSGDADIVDARPAAVRLDTVAIDQFHNVSRVPADDWLGAGVTETLTSALEQLDAVEVVRNPGGSGPAAAWVVDGEYRRRGDWLQIDTRVVDTRSGAVAARSRVEGAAGELFELQDRITADLASALENLSAGGETGFAN